VVALLRARRLERPDLAALRVHALEDALDRAVLAAGVHRLQHYQHAAPVLGVEPGLQVRDALAGGGQLAGHVLLAGVALGLVRVPLRQPRRLARLHPVARVVRLRRRISHHDPLGCARDGSVTGSGRDYVIHQLGHGRVMPRRGRLYRRGPESAWFAGRPEAPRNHTKRAAERPEASLEGPLLGRRDPRPAVGSAG
jgi:hypothetical protein